MPEANSQLPKIQQSPQPAALITGVALVSLMVALLALLLFSWIAEEMRQGDTANFDLFMRTWVHRYSSSGLTRWMILISQLGANVLVATFLLSLLVFVFLRWRRATLWLVITMAGALVLDLGLKYGFHRARPTPFYGPVPHTYSFPSGHALFSFCFYGALAGLLNHRLHSLSLRILLWIVAVALIVAIGFSRIYLGVHYPSDVIAGYLAAALWVSTIVFLDRVRTHRRLRKQAGEFETG